MDRYLHPEKSISRNYRTFGLCSSFRLSAISLSIWVGNHNLTYWALHFSLEYFSENNFIKMCCSLWRYWSGERLRTAPLSQLPNFNVTDSSSSPLCLNSLFWIPNLSSHIQLETWVLSGPSQATSAVIGTSWLEYFISSLVIHLAVFSQNNLDLTFRTMSGTHDILYRLLAIILVSHKWLRFTTNQIFLLIAERLFQSRYSAK